MYLKGKVSQNSRKVSNIIVHKIITLKDLLEVKTETKNETLSIKGRSFK